MKLKNYKELFEEIENIDDETIDGSEDDGLVDESDMDNLLYLLRTMFKNKGIKDVYVENDELDITILVTMNEKEKIESIISVFDTAKRLKRDILPQYDSEFEMYETKDGRPLLCFNFYYGEGLEDDNIAF